MLLLTIVTTAPLASVAAADIAGENIAPVSVGLLTTFAAVVVGSASITAIVMLFFLNSMAKTRKVAYEIRDVLRRFASRHNREDDDRFDILVIRQWESAVAIAKIEGLPKPPLETFPRRAYLDEQDDPGQVMSDVRKAGF